MIRKFKKGTKIVLTKKSIKSTENSAFTPGEKRSGELSRDLIIGKPIYFKNWNDSHATSEVSSVEEVKEEIILETKTSVYSIRIVTDENDKEYQEWINY